MIANTSPLLAHFLNIAIALAIGLLVGSERGWRERGRSEGTRVAGIRTFTLIALFGGLLSTSTSGLAEFQRWLISMLAFLPVAALLIAGYLRSSRHGDDLGITTEVAAMLIFWLGTLPGFGLALPAAASAVVLALVLHLKEKLHYWLNVLNRAELLGTLQFLLVSVVLLPLLPNEGFGPWKAFNPYQLWWMVVLISGLSLVGYFAMRLAGSRKGVVATSLTGGIVSSTAVTLSLSRLNREIRGSHVIAAGILLACATMFARMLLVVTVIDKSLLPHLAAPLGVGMIVLYGAAWLWWRKSEKSAQPAAPQVQNPFQLLPALQFAGLLALVMLGAEALQRWLGDTGLYALSIFTGLADVDAIVLSLAPKSGSTLDPSLVVVCICLAAATNTMMKGIYCRIIGGAELGRKVLWPVSIGGALIMATALAPYLL
ncbi:MAG: MgtC/SapB family protein [Porticoccaceae bacterium]